ncbi:PrsW family intramembrane metalloprotease [Halomicroarcula sp. F28]|uniref:PrsW family intramembrane metalloprotease n=1 Tax=Haloarcula salinisoli TaxID=2487746 RepID=UPI001C72FA16|nr:PrsW family intramembrane metalloprotease [Halomicroarcula salinisoli]MBX0285533.1 PrsW family intramembrane metalloprotease [Halomicroarcula salinisoli]
MRPAKLLRVAKWEVTKNAGGVDRKTIVVMVLAILAMGSVAAVAASGSGPGLNADIYRVGVEESNPYYDVASEDPSFRVQEPDPEAFERRDQDLTFYGSNRLTRPQTEKQAAALEALRSSTEAYNDRTMTRADNQTAAFPVSVTLVYQEQNGTSALDTRTDGDDGTSGDGSGNEGSSSGDNGTDRGTTAGSEGTATDDGSGGDGGAGGDGSDGSGDAAAGGGGANLGGIGAQLTGDVDSGTPGDISPPFPFESLVLAFLYIVPMNFVIQAYGSSMLSERLNRRGELLLVTPASRGDIIGGKTLPYFLGAMGVATAITALLRFSGIAPSGSLVAVAAVLPIAMLFLAATFCGAMFARSFKELTFVTVTITVTLTSYAFVPAIFTDVTPIALISPLTLVVMDLTGRSITLGEFAFSTLPPLFTALVLFGLGAGLYREEDMFTQRSIPLKVLDALAGQIKSRKSALKMSAILIPFVIVAELGAIAFLFVLDSVSLNVFGTNQSLGIVLVLGVVALVEELGKSLHLYAGYAHARYERTLRSALGLGALSGLGFFIAEKGLLIVRLSDLESLPIGDAAVQGATPPAGVPLWAVALLFLFAPLALHAVTAAISSLGASRGRWAYVAGVGVAVVVHFAYNLTVVSSLA